MSHRAIASPRFVGARRVLVLGLVVACGTNGSDPPGRSFVESGGSSGASGVAAAAGRATSGTGAASGASGVSATSGAAGTTASRGGVGATSGDAGSAGSHVGNEGGSAGDDGATSGTGGSAAGSSGMGNGGGIAKPAVPTPHVPVTGTVGPVLKLDLDMQGRSTSEVTELGYTAWPVMTGSTLSGTFEGVKLTFAKAGSNGSGIVATWSKAAVDAPNYSRLAGDGITVEDGDAGAELTLTISGLPAGKHTLLTYHNVPPSSVTSAAPIDVSVDGAVAVNGLAPSLGALSLTKVPTAYVSFTAATGKDIVVTFAAQSGSSAAYKNVVVNALELDTPDASQQATDPSPADNDEHVDADNRMLTLSWHAAPHAVSHDVYFGNDLEALASATHASPLFKGNQAGTRFDVSGLYSIERYYWRIDEIDAAGGVTPGDLWYFRPRQLAFPEAEGYGRFAIGGRGGVVVHVTNLNDSGPGSLRDAIETDRGPRTVVFDVGGIIPLASRLSLNQAYVTVAGQTAPGKGICLRAAPFGLSGAHDVVLRNVRLRLGHGQTYDGMGMQGSEHSIFDHASISWTIDEAFSSRSAKNITLQRSLVSECLNVAGHQNYPAGTAHGYAASIGGDVGSFHHNLLAHCEGRNWSLAGGLDPEGNFAGRLDIFDNVVYNWSGRTTDGGAHEVNFVNNYYEPGGASEIFTALNAEYDEFPGTQQYYFAGNVMPGHFDPTNQDQGRVVSSGAPDGYSAWVNAPFFPSYARIDSAEDAYKSVLSDVGANQPVLDEHDVRVIHETLTGTATYEGSVSGKPGLPDSETDVGGYETYPSTSREDDWDSDADGLPDFWERARGLDPQSAANDATDPNRDADGNGYTELDEYLEWMSLPHFFTSPGAPVTVDLAKSFIGYSATPSYSSPAAVNGTASISDTMATFAPSGCGFASFELAVKDRAGSAMTKTYVVFVEGC